MKYTTEIAKFDEGLYMLHIKVPDKIYKKLSSDGNKRIICQIDENEAFHGGLMPDGQGGNYIMLSKPKLKKFKLHLGQKVSVKLEKDTTKYGMKMPEEFEAVLSSDFDGETVFEKLTDGKKRSLIHLVATVKNPDLRISKAITILDHLKINEGRLDFKMLNEALKNANRR